jgi:hypothetical protein
MREVNTVAVEVKPEIGVFDRDVLVVELIMPVLVFALVVGLLFCLPVAVVLADAEVVGVVGKKGVGVYLDTPFEGEPPVGGGIVFQQSLEGFVVFAQVLGLVLGLCPKRLIIPLASIVPEESLSSTLSCVV